MTNITSSESCMSLSKAVEYMLTNLNTDNCLRSH